MSVPFVLSDTSLSIFLDFVPYAVPTTHPFKVRYHEKVERVAWESCSTVLNNQERRKWLARGWKA